MGIRRMLACGLLLAAAACGGGGASTKGSGEPTLLDLAPDDAVGTVRMDLARLRKSSLFSRVTKLFSAVEEQNPATARLLSATDEVVLALKPPKEGADQGSLAVLARGRFTSAELEASHQEQAKRQGMTAVPFTESGFSGFRFDKGPRSFFARKNVIANVEEPWFPAMVTSLTHPDGKAPLALITADAVQGGHVFDFAVDLASIAHVAEGVAEADAFGMQDAESASGSVDLTDDLIVDVTAQMKTVAAATKLAAAVEQARTRAAKELFVQMLGLSPVLEGVQMTVTDARVRVQVTVKQEILTGLLDRFSSLIEEVFDKIQNEIQPSATSPDGPAAAAPDQY